jgi:hypothetical protein
MNRRAAAAVATVCAAVIVTVAPSVAAASTKGGAVSARQLRSYMAEVEKVRLPVNTLLAMADPILDAYDAKTITPTLASLKMNALEETFARFLLAMQEIRPANATLAKVNRPYAHTYYLEDNYLSTLASDLNEGEFDNLPNTQDQQRLAIIVWRTQMELLAKRAKVTLPADLVQAGRGEIAPAPSGS